MILVTGGSGWLGSELVEQLLKQDKQVRVLITDENNRIKQLKEEYKENLEILIGNICNIEDIKKALKDIDEVYHLAAKVHSIPKNKEDEELFYKVNRDATEQIFNECIIKKVKKVIFFSTVSVYGNPEEIITTKTDKNPINAYGKSKMEAENIANIMYKEKGLPIIIIEPVTVYGEGDVGNFKKIENLAKKGFTVKFGNGENKKTIIYYKDLVQMVLNISKEDSNIGKTFICGTETISINNINKALKERYKKVLNIWIPKFITNIMSAFSRILRLNGINRKITALTSNNELKCSSILDNFTSYKEYYSNKNKVQKRVLFTATVDSHIKHFHIPYLKMFKEQGYEVHVATNGCEDIEYCDKKHIISFERSPFKINNIKAIKQLKNIIKEEKYEIIHTHTPMGSVVTRLAAKESRKSGTRVIYTAHGFHFYKGAPLLNWLMFYPIEKHLSKITDDLITINNEDYELAKKKFKSQNTHLVQGVGVDPKKFNFEFSEGDKEKLREEIGISKEDFIMIYPAELSKRKNQTMLIEAMKELVKEDKKYKLLLPGKDSLNGKHKQLVKKYNLQDNVKFLGYRTDIPKLFKISNLAVSTSRQEGLPVNLIEAMMCGLPIIATDCRGNRDLVSDNENSLIIKQNNKQKFIKRIKELADKEELKKNYDKVQKYMIGSIKKEMKKIYNIKKHVQKKEIKGKISIIMGIYNCERYLRESIDSIIAQTYTNWELIMCDDGSQDKTYEIANEYCIKYPEKIILLKNNENKGLNYTLNKCATYATGEYIGRQDGDDVSLPTRFEKEIKIIKENIYALVSTNMIFFDETGEFGESKNKEVPEKNDFISGSPFCHAPCIIKSDIFQEVRGYTDNEKLLRVEDYHLWFKIYEKGYKGYTIKESLYKMRDDRDAYRRRTWKNRINEAYVKFIGFKMLKINPIYYIFIFRPVILGLMPHWLYNILHKKKLKNK